MKRKAFICMLLIIMVMACGMISHAYMYRYPNQYVMTYTLNAIMVGSESGGGATTSTESEAVSFVSLFSYKNGVAKNSASKQQDYYVYLALPGKGGNTMTSHHALKYSSGTPCGETRSITIN